MAKPAPLPANAPKTEKPAKKGFGTKIIIICMIMAIGAVAMLPTTIIIVLGLIPTWVAYVVDDSRDRSLGRVVLCLNFAGVLPSLLRLWQHGHTTTNALNIVMEPIMMALMLIPAAFAWMIYSYVPYLVVGIVRRKAEMRIRSLDKSQEDLVEQWGDRVTGLAHKNEADEIAPEKLASDFAA